MTMASIFAGIAYGGFASMYPLITSDEFGLEGFGYTWGWVMLSTPIANFAFQTLSGHIYDSNTEPGTKQCYGEHCYHLTFLVSALCCFAGFLISLLLLRKNPLQPPTKVKEISVKDSVHTQLIN